MDIELLKQEIKQYEEILAAYKAVLRLEYIKLNPPVVECDEHGNTPYMMQA